MRVATLEIIAGPVNARQYLRVTIWEEIDRIRFFVDDVTFDLNSWQQQQMDGLIHLQMDYHDRNTRTT